jgi:Ca-activated chloride channel family protein
MNETTEQGWKLEELARQAGVSPRTVRYYVQRGLLPAPVFRGRDTVYTSEHLLRLQVIRRLQERFLPLDEIQREIERCSPDELRKLAAGHDGVGSLPRLLTGERPVSQRGLRQKSAPPLDEGECWQRWVLAAGLELHLSEAADTETRNLAEALRREFARRGAKGGYK